MGTTGLVFDPLFRLPFITGLLLAAVLPLLASKGSDPEVSPRLRYLKQKDK